MTLLIVTAGTAAIAQRTTIIAPPANGRAIVIAGKEYEAGTLKRFFKGDHYRTEWATAVTVPVFNIDTLGGLRPTEQGGGRQTLTLRLKDPKGKEYVLRSINKTYGGALPESMRGSFIEKFANDQVSSAHPFAAITVAPLAEAAGIYHTWPIIVLVPESPRLGAFNKDFANTLCLFEERPDDDQSDAANFGHSKEVISTEKLLNRLKADTRNQVDQPAYVRARLFDMFVGDWGRHEDQWRWARFETPGGQLYRPIPRDRDQTYTLFDGLLIRIATSPESLEHLQTFKGEINNLKKYNFPPRHLDRRIAAGADKDLWVATARSLQAALTDAVIDSALHRLPPEIYNISGAVIAQKLKSRRNLLEKYAREYSDFLSEEVEIVGSEAPELFLAERISDQITRISIFPLNSQGIAADKPVFTRDLDRAVTDEIRLYGIDGKDRYLITGKTRKTIPLRIIAGPDTDSLRDESNSGGLGRKTKVYDNPGLLAVTGPETRLHLRSDSAVNLYRYDAFKANTGSIIKAPGFTNTRGVHINTGYKYRKYSWRKDPFNWEQSLKLNYSITNNSFGVKYAAEFNQLVGRWSLLADGVYDQQLRHFYYGTGNDTKAVNDREFYRLLTSEAGAALGLSRRIGSRHQFTVSGLYQSVDLLNDPGHYASIVIPLIKPDLMERKHFAGAGFIYSFNHVNNLLFPTRGVNFTGNVQHLQNVNEKQRSLTRYQGIANGYIPLSNVFSLALRVGGALVTGEPEFYQLGWIGGGQTLRGYRRERFYGRSTFYNMNELRWLPKVKTKLFSGHAGLIGFVDQGRVWQPGENSDTWHRGYGAGIMLVPFDRFTLSVSYGISEESRVIAFRVGNLF